METVLNFQNIDSEDFVGMYTGEEIPVREGETKAFTKVIAEHIAGQLATKILIREGKDYLTDPKREELIKQMLGEIVVPPVEKEEAEKPAEPAEPVKKEKEFVDLKKKPRRRKK